MPAWLSCATRCRPTTTRTESARRAGPRALVAERRARGAVVAGDALHAGLVHRIAVGLTAATIQIGAAGNTAPGRALAERRRGEGGAAGGGVVATRATNARVA